ncbi:sensor domain-containing diguanylate cyclase [Planctobacterium marinum]|uniref:sensor domain-containing diguanylate cyclase n=1 Tax=Planctobacterium marinum TaxID=1631968 RepID=UPI001E557DDE|nr:sensor domain-containing diguanylate cyclase [Planctobacterium marinum]MCC2606743.1 diguanylate cyclase [Planctobacterium marinum]
MSDIDALNLKKLLEHAHIGVVIHRWDTSIVYANPTALRLMRLSYEQMIGIDAYDPQWSFLDEGGRKLLVEDYPVNKVKMRGDRLQNEIVGVVDSSSDHISWFLVNAYHEGEPGEESGFIVVTFNDISDTKQLFSFQDIVENTQDMVIVTEAENIEYPTGPKIVYVNKAFEKLTGYSQREILGETPRLLQGALTDQDAKTRIHAALEKHQPIYETLLNYDSDGRPYWVEMNIIPLKNKYGDITHFAAIERDISKQKFHLEQLEKRNEDLKVLKRDLEKSIEKRTSELQMAKARLEKLAFYDPLTNVPNRRYFIDHVNRLVKSSQRRHEALAFGMLDIDDFKLLNDNYGHDVGDKVLIELAQVLQALFRADDAFCRYGGEEFAFVLTIGKNSELDGFSNRLISAIRDLEVAINEQQSLNITASIGMKVCAHDADIDFEKEIKDADIALYESKNTGKDKVTIS